MVSGLGLRSARGVSTASNSSSTWPVTSQATDANDSIELSSGLGPSASMSVTTKVVGLVGSMGGGEVLKGRDLAVGSPSPLRGGDRGGGLFRARNAPPA